MNGVRVARMRNLQVLMPAASRRSWCHFGGDCEARNVPLGKPMAVQARGCRKPSYALAATSTMQGQPAEQSRLVEGMWELDALAYSACRALSTLAASVADVRSNLDIQELSRSGKATVCGVGRSKCEPGALPKVADCGLGPQDLQYNMVYVGEAFGKLSLFEADGPYKLLYHKERLATWQICKAVLF